MNQYDANLANEQEMVDAIAAQARPTSRTAALDAEYRKVIPAKFVTRRDGSTMACMTCGSPLVLGAAFAATHGNGWHSYCSTCAASTVAQVGGLVKRVEALVAPLGDDVPAVVTTMVEAATPMIERALGGDGESFLPAKSVLLGIREQVGIAKKAAAPATVRANNYGGKCGTCKAWVEAQAGRIEKVNGRWVTFHLDGQCPAAAAPVGPVENGLYLHTDGAIHKVYTTQNGRPGAKVLIVRASSGSFEYVKGGVRKVAEALAAGTARLLTQDEAAAFGRQHGFCVNCALDLTDDRSLAAGYGPVCARNRGWYYPTAHEAAAILQRPIAVPEATPEVPRNANGRVIRTFRDQFRADND